mmetsp:Transcript_112811/g.329668  ORF Transcript_112811/g.329668 Transcript_112811/m.329668 type:complete len:259 (-) Transcript_112811:3602-4378(-)
MPDQGCSRLEAGLQGHGALANVVPAGLLNVSSALVALHGDPALLAIILGFGLDARQAPDAVLCGAFQDLQGLAHLEPPERLALRDVERRGDDDASPANEQLLDLKVQVALRVLQGDPAGLAVLAGPALEPLALHRRLLLGAEEDFQDLADLRPEDLLAAALKGGGHEHLLLAAEVGLRALVKEVGALVAAQGHPALLLVLERSALHARQARGLVDLGRLNDLHDLAREELADRLAVLDLEGRRQGDVLHAPMELLQQL